MTKAKKVKIVKKLVKKLKENPNFVLVSFANLSHQKLERLRKKLQTLSNSLQVVKNSLFKVAAKKAGKKQIVNQKALKGTSALLTLSSDWTKGLSTFYQFAKNEEGVSFKIGILEGRVYQKEDLITLAQLPSKEELMAKISISLKSPATRLVNPMKLAMIRITAVLKSQSAR